MPYESLLYASPRENGSNVSSCRDTCHYPKINRVFNYVFSFASDLIRILIFPTFKKEIGGSFFKTVERRPKV